MAKFLSDVEQASKSWLKSLAKLAPKEDEKSPTQGMHRGEKSQPRGDTAPDLGPLNVEKYLSHYGVAYNVKKGRNKTLYLLNNCLFDPAHKKKEASIVQDDQGLLTYQCFHNSCRDYTWHDAREKISGRDPLAPFCKNYDPNWQPKDPAQKPIDPDKPFLKQNEKGRVSFNAALLANYLEKEFQPVINEGRDFGSLFYHYNSRGVWHILPEAAVRKVARRALGDHAQSRRISDAVTLLEDQCYVPAEKLEVNPMWLNLRNCMLNLITMKTAPHSPKFNSRVQLPVEYDPKAHCGLWIESLTQIFADDTEKANALQEFFGYCLYPKILFPAAVFQIGGGANGKGTVQRVLEAMLGDDNVSHISLKRMEEKFGPVELKDKLLNACGETATQPLEVTRFKEVAAGDKVQAEVKYKPDVIFVPIAKHLISMNEFPGIKDKTDAFFRRVIVLEYRQKFEGERDDKELSDKLLKEINGIFMWALEGLKRVLAKHAIYMPESVIQAKKRFRARVNPVIMFVEEECDVHGGASCLPKDLFNRYKEWCEESKVRSLGKQKFYEQVLLNFDVEKHRDETREFFYGIGLRDFSGQESF